MFKFQDPQALGLKCMMPSGTQSSIDGLVYWILTRHKKCQCLQMLETQTWAA